MTGEPSLNPDTVNRSVALHCGWVASPVGHCDAILVSTQLSYTFLPLWCGSSSLGCLILTLTSLDLRCLAQNELAPLSFCQKSTGSRRLCMLCSLTADSFEAQPWIVEQNSMLRNILSHYLALELAGIITFIHLKLPDRTANRHWYFGDPRRILKGTMSSQICGIKFLPLRH